MRSYLGHHFRNLLVHNFRFIIILPGIAFRIGVHRRRYSQINLRMRLYRLKLFDNLYIISLEILSVELTLSRVVSPKHYHNNIWGGFQSHVEFFCRHHRHYTLLHSNTGDSVINNHSIVIFDEFSEKIIPLSDAVSNKHNFLLL